MSGFLNDDGHSGLLYYGDESPPVTPQARTTPSMRRADASQPTSPTLAKRTSMRIAVGARNVPNTQGSVSRVDLSQLARRLHVPVDRLSRSLGNASHLAAYTNARDSEDTPGAFRSGTSRDLSAVRTSLTGGSALNATRSQPSPGAGGRDTPSAANVPIPISRPNDAWGPIVHSWRSDKDELSTFCGGSGLGRTLDARIQEQHFGSQIENVPFRLRFTPTGAGTLTVGSLQSRRDSAGMLGVVTFALPVNAGAFIDESYGIHTESTPAGHVVITAVDDPSAALEDGFLAEMQILSVDGHPVRSGDDALKACQHALADSPPAAGRLAAAPPKKHGSTAPPDTTGSPPAQLPPLPSRAGACPSRISHSPLSDPAAKADPWATHATPVLPGEDGSVNFGSGVTGITGSINNDSPGRLAGKAERNVMVYVKVAAARGRLAGSVHPAHVQAVALSGSAGLQMPRSSKCAADAAAKRSSPSVPSKDPGTGFGTPVSLGGHGASYSPFSPPQSQRLSNSSPPLPGHGKVSRPRPGSAEVDRDEDEDDDDGLAAIHSSSPSESGSVDDGLSINNDEPADHRQQRQQQQRAPLLGKQRRRRRGAEGSGGEDTEHEVDLELFDGGRCGRVVAGKSDSAYFFRDRGSRTPTYVAVSSPKRSFDVVGLPRGTDFQSPTASTPAASAGLGAGLLGYVRQVSGAMPWSGDRSPTPDGESVLDARPLGRVVATPPVSPLAPRAKNVNFADNRGSDLVTSVRVYDEIETVIFELRFTFPKWVWLALLLLCVNTAASIPALFRAADGGDASDSTAVHKVMVADLLLELAYSAVIAIAYCVTNARNGGWEQHVAFLRVDYGWVNVVCSGVAYAGAKCLTLASLTSWKDCTEGAAGPPLACPPLVFRNLAPAFLLAFFTVARWRERDRNGTATRAYFPMEIFGLALVVVGSALLLSQQAAGVTLPNAGFCSLAALGTAVDLLAKRRSASQMPLPLLVFCIHLSTAPVWLMLVAVRGFTAADLSRLVTGPDAAAFNVGVAAGLGYTVSSVLSLSHLHVYPVSAIITLGLLASVASSKRVYDIPWDSGSHVVIPAAMLSVTGTLLATWANVHHRSIIEVEIMQEKSMKRRKASGIKGPNSKKQKGKKKKKKRGAGSGHSTPEEVGLVLS